MKYLLDSGGSVLDLMDEARSLERRVTSRDRDKLGESSRPCETWNGKFKQPIGWKNLPQKSTILGIRSRQRRSLFGMRIHHVRSYHVGLGDRFYAGHFIPRAGIGPGIHHKWATA